MRNGRKREINHRVKNSFQKFLTFSIITILLVGSVATCVRPIPVEASISGSGTLAGLITTLVISLGLSPTSTAYTNGLNSAGFNNVTIEQVADGTYNAAAIDQAISSTGVDLSSITDVLSTSSNEATAINNAAGLTGSNALSAASAGTNIEAAAKNYVDTGEVSIAQGGMAANVLNGTGSLLPIFYDQKYQSEKMLKMEKLASQGLAQTTSDILANQLYDGGGVIGVKRSETSRKNYVYPANVFVIGYNPDEYNGYYLTFWSYDDTTITVKRVLDSGQVSNFGGNPYKTSAREYDIVGNVIYTSYTSIFDVNALAAQIRNGEVEVNNNVVSPDLNTQNGNMTATYNPTTNNYTVNFSPTINYNTDGTSTNNKYITEVVNQNDYNDYSTTVNNNTTNKNYTDNGLEFSQLVDTITSEKNNDIINPDTDTSTDIPVQPTTIPKPTNTEEQNTENVSTMATVDLKDVFPFCIPWDLYNMISKFTANREAPEFNFTLNLGPAGNHEINIDFSEWDSVATILRALELIIFIVGLAVVTRNLIGS